MMAKGVLAMIAASVAYGIMPVFSKLILQEGLNADSVVVYRLVLSSIFSLLFLLKGHSFRLVTRKQILHLMLFGVLGFGMTMNLLTLAYQYIPTGIVTMLHFAYPLVIIVAMYLLYKEKITKYKAAAVCVALAGIALLADFSQGLALKGVLLALASGVSYAVFVIAGKKSSYAVLPPMQVILFVCFFSAVFFGGKAFVSGTLQVPSNGKTWVYLCGISLGCTVFALAMLTYGIRVLGASTASVLNMIEPLVSVVAGVVLFSEPMNGRTALGCTAILLASIVTIYGECKAQQKLSMNRKE